EVSHLPSGTRSALAIQVEVDAGDLQRGAPVRLAVGPDVAEDVDHGRGGAEVGGAERKIADRTDQLLELAGGAAIQGAVVAVVRTRRELVDQQPSVARVEEFDGEQPLQREGFGDATRDALGLLADAIRKG